MPAPHLPEFRLRAVQLAREGTAPVAKIARDLGISESRPRTWMAQADADENGAGRRLAGAEKRELAELRGRDRLLEQENEIPRRAAACFARENVFPQIAFRLARELAADGMDAAAAGRALGVPRSGYYEWKERPVPALVKRAWW